MYNNFKIIEGYESKYDMIKSETRISESSKRGTLHCKICHVGYGWGWKKLKNNK